MAARCTTSAAAMRHFCGMGVQVQQLVVRDEQDIRALATELAALTRRQQRGKGFRMA